MAVLGRVGITWPDLGTAGGTSLEEAVHGGVESISDRLISKWEVVTDLPTATNHTIVHNLGVALADLRVVIIRDGAPIDYVAFRTQFILTQVNTNSINIQHNMGGTQTFTVLVMAHNEAKSSGVYKAFGATTSDSSQSILALTIPENTTVAVSAMVNAYEISTATPSAFVSINALATNSGGTITINEISRTELMNITGGEVNIDSIVSPFIRLVIKGQDATILRWVARVITSKMEV